MKYFKCILFLVCSLTSFGQGSWTVKENEAISPTNNGMSIVFRSTEFGDFVGVKGSFLNELMGKEVWEIEFYFILANGQEKHIYNYPQRKTAPFWIPMTRGDGYRDDVLHLLKIANSVRVRVLPADREDIERGISLKGSSTAINQVKH